MGTELHPDVEPLGFLLATWRGRGTGGYPTVDPFEYEEELAFEHVGKPYLLFRQRTWVTRGPSGVPSHMELAFWRGAPNGRIEVVSAYPNGIAEIELGEAAGTTVELATAQIVAARTAKQVVRLERSFVVEGHTLAYDVRMDAVGQGLAPHLHAVLQRQR